MARWVMLWRCVKSELITVEGTRTGDCGMRLGLEVWALNGMSCPFIIGLVD